MPQPISAASEVFTQERILKKLRRERDAAAARGDHAEALILNDRIDDVKAGRHLAVERAMASFESALARRRARANRQPTSSQRTPVMKAREVSAYNKGAEARRRGKSIDANPYTQSANFWAWKTGYKDQSESFCPIHVE